MQNQVDFLTCIWSDYCNIQVISPFERKRFSMRHIISVYRQFPTYVLSKVSSMNSRKSHVSKAFVCNRLKIEETFKFVRFSKQNYIFHFDAAISMMDRTLHSLKKILWGHGHTKFGRRIRSLQQFIVQQLPNEKVSEPYEMFVNFRIIIT